MLKRQHWRASYLYIVLSHGVLRVRVAISVEIQYVCNRPTSKDDKWCINSTAQMNLTCTSGKVEDAPGRGRMGLSNMCYRAGVHPIASA